MTYQQRTTTEQMGVRPFCTAAIAVGAAIAVLAGSTSPAAAACTPAASSSPIAPPAGTTVTCSGATLAQNGDNGYGTGDQSGLTINVLTAASVFGNLGASPSGIAVNTNNTINNSGDIGAFTYGISATGALTVLNTASGSITSNVAGIVTGGALALNNAGTVSSGTTAVSAASFDITNSGSISGAGHAILASGAGTINNSGSVTSATTGIETGTDLRVTNSSGATISGGGFGVISGLTMRVDNAGTISTLGDTAISAGTSGTVSNTGTIIGYLTGIVFGTDGVVSNSAMGTIAGNAYGVRALGSVIVNNAGNLFASTYGVSASSFDITNSGIITGSSNAAVASGAGVLVNSGSMTSSVTAVQAGTDLRVTNTSTGTISGPNAGLHSGLTMQVDNAGSIISATTAISVGSSGTVRNSGTVNGAGNGIEFGTDGIVSNTSSGTITGNGAVGVLAFGSVVIDNAGQLDGRILGVVAGTTATIVNSGTISGGAVAESGTITNTGSISGIRGLDFSGGPSTVFNSGTITSTFGTAISFAGTGNVLTLGPGFVINGNVLGTGADTFQLGGEGSGAFDATALGVQYTGFSTFNKVGSSTFDLTGTGTQDWNVQSGTLLANGNFGGTYIVSGGTLGGTGTIGGLVVQANGTVSPGPTIGTLNVSGPVTFNAGSTYQVDVNAAGQSDRIAAGGAATLHGGQVRVVLQSPPAAFATPQTYTILSAASVAGTYDALVSPSAFLDERLIYLPQQVQLAVALLPFTSAAQTPNQFSVAGALTAGDLDNALGNAVFNLPTAAAARQAFDALSGEVHASVQTSLINDSHYIRDAVLGRLRNAGFASDGGPIAALAFAGPGAMTDASSVENDPQMMAYRAMATKAPLYKALPAYRPDTALWAQAFGGWATHESDGNAATMARSLGGFVTGVDRITRDGWRFGLAGGYSRSDVSVDARQSSATIDSYHVSLYGGGQLAGFNLRAGAAFSEHDIATSRSIAFPGFFDSARADYHGSTSQAFGEIGRGFAWYDIAIEPFAGLAYVHLQSGSFSERSGTGIAALNGQSGSDDTGYSSLGFRAASPILLADGTILTPRAALSWQHAYGDVVPSTALAFQSTGAAFDIRGVPLARDTALVEAGVDMTVSHCIKIGLSYSGQLSDAVRDQAIKGNLVWRF